MQTYIIKQKMSGTGTIHDMASGHFDRKIRFPKGHLFAVVMAAYYGWDQHGEGGYTTHKSEEAAVRKSAKLSNEGYSHEIIDVNGVVYISDGQRLVVK